MCKGRLQGFYPICLPQGLVLSKKVIFAEHKRSLHEGVAMTMSHVRSLFWIPHLRRLSKSVIRNCYGCKKFRSLPHHFLKPVLLPNFCRAEIFTMQKNIGRRGGFLKNYNKNFIKNHTRQGKNYLTLSLTPSLNLTGSY